MTRTHRSAISEIAANVASTHADRGASHESILHVLKVWSHRVHFELVGLASDLQKCYLTAFAATQSVRILALIPVGCFVISTTGRPITAGVHWIPYLARSCSHTHPTERTVLDDYFFGVSGKPVIAGVARRRCLSAAGRIASLASLHGQWQESHGQQAQQAA